MLKDIAARVQKIKPSPTLAVSQRAEELIRAGKKIINLGIGEPDFDTPNFIKEAAIKAINNGMTKYTAVDGTLSLKKAIIEKFKRDNQLDYEPSQILVSCGAKHSLYNLFASILNPDDEIIIPAPYWVSYPDMAMLVDAKPVIVNTSFANHFKMTPEQLQNAITNKTKLVVLNSPSNPTGSTYHKDELAALAAILLQYKDIFVVSDDIYEHSIWGLEPFVNILMSEPKLYDQCIIVNGISKAYAMTGWRIGYAAGPQKIIAAMKKIQSQSTSNPTSISQAAAEAALNGNQDCTKEMTDAYHKRHDYIFNELSNMPGIKCIKSQGTFYIFPNAEELINRATSINNDIDLAEYLLNEAEIAVIPGSAFGAPNFLRISYATSLATLKEAMQRMHKACEKLLK